jgi:hypothetical protein
MTLPSRINCSIACQISGRRAVNVIHLIEIDVIGLQSPQAGLAGATDVIGGEPRSLGPVSIGWYTLVASTILVATSALRQQVADDLLGFAEPFSMSGDCGPP